MTDKLTIQSWPMSTRTPETKLTVDGETMRIFSNPEPPSIVFRSSAAPVMTIHPDGKITLAEDADPSEAAAACIEAMVATLTNMIDNAVKAEREAIAKWLRAQWEPGCWVDYNELADCVTGEVHLT
jgi:hypothetical protein